MMKAHRETGLQLRTELRPPGGGEQQEASKSHWERWEGGRRREEAEPYMADLSEAHTVAKQTMVLVAKV